MALNEAFRAFKGTPEEFWSRYSAWQVDLESRFRLAQRAAGIDDAVTESILRTATSNKSMLDALPFDDAESLMQAFRSNVLEFDSGYIEPSWSRVGKGGGDVTIGRFVAPSEVAQDIVDHPLAYTLRGMSIQEKAVPGTDALEYSFGRNIPRMGYLQNMHMGAKAGIGEGQSIFIFDTETMGLTSEQAGVREISGLTARRSGDQMIVDAQSVMTRHMNVARSGYGAVYDKATGRTMRMDDYVARLAGGNIGGSAADGYTFMENVLPFLQQMDQADFVVAHNAGFDIDQVVANAMRTSQYLNNTPVGTFTNVKGIVDSVSSKIASGQVLDTLRMAEEYFGNNLGLAAELDAMMSPRPFSLENIMLQTNLGELIEADMPGFLADMGSSQHKADVDVRITSKLIEAMQNKTLMSHDPVTGESLGLGLGQYTSRAEREIRLKARIKTLTSYAPTPVSNIANIAHMSPELFEKVFEEGGDSLRIRQILTGDEVDVGASGKTAREWYDILSSDSNMQYIASPKMTLMEQHIYEGRRLDRLTLEGVESVADSVGMWSGYSGFNTPYEGVLNRLHTLFKRANIPSDKSFAEFQSKMHAAGMPFSGISLEERILTGGLASASKQKSTVNRALSARELRAVQVGEDLGVSRFAMQTKFNNTRSGVLAMPFEIIKQAEEAGVLQTSFRSAKEAQMLSLSTVSSTKNVNLMLDVSEDEAGNLIRWMEEALGSPTERRLLVDSGVSSELLSQIKESFIEGEGYKHGINIGYLDEAAGTQAYHTISDMLQNLTRDKDKIPLRVGFISSSMGAEDKGIIRTGAVILDRLMSDAERSNYKADLGIAASRSEQLMDEMSNVATAARTKMKYSVGSSELAERADVIYDAIKKRGPVVAGAAALVFGGYYAYKKHSERKEYDETMDEMDYESVDDYARYRQEMGLQPAPAVRRMDPMATAGVVGNLHHNAIGHTQMGPNRYSGLFSSV